MTSPQGPPNSERGPAVSVVVPTAGRMDLLAPCLSSLASDDNPSTEVIVVDSGPPDGIHAACAAAALPVIVIDLRHPVGFAAAVNVGLVAARGRYLLVLNNDVRVGAGFLAHLVSAAEASGSQLVVPRVLSMLHPERIDNTGNTLYPDGLNLCRGRGCDDGPQHRSPVDPLLPSGAAMLLGRGLLTRIGGFDSGFFAYGEDAELGLRAL